MGVRQAYVTPQSLDTAQLAMALADHLPPHMMPSHMVALEEMPLLYIDGCVDRGALPLPDWAAADVRAVHSAPDDGLEAELQATWQDVPGLGRVGTHCDISAIGGTDMKVPRCRAGSSAASPLHGTVVARCILKPYTPNSKPRRTQPAPDDCPACRRPR